MIKAIKKCKTNRWMPFAGELIVISHVEAAIADLKKCFLSLFVAGAGKHSGRVSTYQSSDLGSNPTKAGIFHARLFCILCTNSILQISLSFETHFLAKCIFSLFTA